MANAITPPVQRPEYQGKSSSNDEEIDKPVELSQSNSDSQIQDLNKIRNMATGDMLNTEIPGGLDLDITTPF